MPTRSTAYMPLKTSGREIKWELGLCKGAGNPERFYAEPDRNDDDEGKIKKNTGSHKEAKRRAQITKEAKELCNGSQLLEEPPCPIRDDCLSYALTNFTTSTDYGVWGGTTKKERAKIKERWA